MNFIISITNPGGDERIIRICEKLKLSQPIIMHGRGTASKTILDLLGNEIKERRIVFSVADDKLTEKFIAEQKRHLYIDSPGRGVVVAVPVKSVGGGRTLTYLGGNKEEKKLPDIDFRYELIIVILNEGYTDEVMDAARLAGATGGTILHGKGTGSKSAEKFFKVSIAQEKEVLIIVSGAAQKAAIMSTILKMAGPDTDAGAITFSLPVSEVAGFALLDDAEK